MEKPRSGWEDVVLRKDVLQVLETENEGDELGIEKNGSTFEGGQGPDRAVASYIDEFRVQVFRGKNI
jgi:hypothetical protein